MPITKEFLDSQHPIYKANVAEWERRERLLRGGIDVVETELVRFENETEDGDSYASRKTQAVFPGFGEAFVRTLVGHVLKDRPESDGGLQMGQMGNIKRAQGRTQPSEAELVFYNVNGVGGDGQQLWQWISSVFHRAGATGVRWVMVEAPPWAGGQPSQQDVLNGQRPYAVEFSPRSVTNWRIDRGRLDWCIVRIRQDTRKMEEGKLVGEANELGYYLLVRKGFDGLGAELAGGGWWKFSADGAEIDKGTGNWEKTRGEIPMAFAVWEWETEAVGDDTPLPLGRSVTTWLDNLSVAYMNAKSAWRHNAWRSAGGPTFLLGVDSETWKIAVEQWNEGPTLMGVPASRGGEGPSPSVEHSGAALVSADSFKALLQDMTAEAERMMVKEATSTPDSSGRSKEAGFTESKAPRLTMLAENIESFLNTLLRFFEMRFGHSNPTAEVQMPRQFDLAPIVMDIRDFFDTFRRAEMRSATLETEAILRLAEQKQLVTDKNRDQVKKELEDSVRAAVTASRQEGGFLADLFRQPATEEVQ